MAEPAPSEWMVDYSGLILAGLRNLHRRAKDLGIGRDYGNLIKTINRRLETDPVGWGDPLYQLHHLGIVLSANCRVSDSQLRRGRQEEACDCSTNHTIAESSPWAGIVS